MQSIALSKSNYLYFQSLPNKSVFQFIRNSRHQSKFKLFLSAYLCRYWNRKKNNIGKKSLSHQVHPFLLYKKKKSVFKFTNKKKNCEKNRSLSNMFCKEKCIDIFSNCYYPSIIWLPSSFRRFRTKNWSVWKVVEIKQVVFYITYFIR